MGGNFRASAFFLTGLVWLILASLLGLGLFFGMVLASSLPPVLRSIHVHGALVGGVAQMILGAILAFVPPLLHSEEEQSSQSYPGLYFAFNGGTLGLVLGFSMQSHLTIGIAGLFIILAFLPSLIQSLKLIHTKISSIPVSLWIYGLALLVLLSGLAIGEAMAFRLISLSDMGSARLAHIHFNVLGFVTLAIIGTMHHFFPTILKAPLHSAVLGRLTFFLVPGGVIALIIGFLVNHLWIQIGAGALLITGTVVYAYNIFQTWNMAGKPKSIASDHLMVATIFLVISILTGVLVSLNYLWDPPKFPMGTIHLMAYTHLALIGFILHTIFGALSHVLPTSLANARVSSLKNRETYLAQLMQTVEQWRSLQVTTLTMGTLGIALVATLLWQFPLYSPEVKYTTWGTMGFLFLSFILFSVKIGVLWSKRPSE